MHRSELSKQQSAALDKIAAAGADGLARFDAARRVAINGNCVHALYRLGLIESWAFPLKLTDAGRATQAGQDFTPARWIYFSRVDGGFWQRPTFDYGAAYGRWTVDLEQRTPGRPSMLDSRREDEFRRIFPGVEIVD